MKEDRNVADFFSSGAKEFLISQHFAEFLARIYFEENRIYSIVHRPYVTTFTFTLSMWSISLLDLDSVGFSFVNREGRRRRERKKEKIELKAAYRRESEVRWR